MLPATNPQQFSRAAIILKTIAPLKKSKPNPITVFKFENVNFKL